MTQRTGIPRRPGSRDTARLRALTGFAKVVSAARSYDDVLRLVAVEARQALDASMVSLSMWDRGSGLLRTLVNEGDLADDEVPLPRDETYPVEDSPLVSRMLLEERGVVVWASGGGPDHDPTLIDMLRRRGRGSAVLVPVRAEGRVWGELFAARGREDPPYTVADLDFAEAVAAQAAAGVAQAEHVARVEQLAFSDPLTGLGNRRALDDRLDAAVSRHADDGTEVALVLVDINGLKTVNDSEGHEAGDRLIVTFGAELSSLTSHLPGALAARIGGDEFCVVTEGVGTDRVVQFAEELCRRAAVVIPEGVSCGVVSTTDLPAEVTDPSQLVRLADAAQYRAKRAGLRHPMVVGRQLPPDNLAALRSPVERRTVRIRGVDGGRLLESGIDAVDAVESGGVVARLAAVAHTLAVATDAAAWWISECPRGDDRMYTRAHGAVRAPAGYQDVMRQFFEDPAGYAMADFPATVRAMAGGLAVIADVDDPRSDPHEVSLLVLEGCTALVMAGGADAVGSRWVVEIHADEISTPVQSYAPVLRLLVSVAIVTTGDDVAARVPPSADEP